MLAGAGIRVLEGEPTVLDVAGARLGVAGVKGFGGGFVGARHRLRRAGDEGVRRATRRIADTLEGALDERRRRRLARGAACITPRCKETLVGEPPEI